MPLRCVVFSSDQSVTRPIWQAFADLDIEGEYCSNAVEAVERVTTQLFQIVITDWDDQPEAAFLLKTARELKAAQRPLTLAIVKDEASLPQALHAGANSILRKPIQAEQVRDTLSTACDLLRAKVEPSPPAVAASSKPPAAFQAFAAAASAGTAPAPAFISQTPEKALRSGEFLQSASSAPGAQFDTEADPAVSMEQSAATEVDPLTELEPTAAAVESPATEPPMPQEEPRQGWSSLEDRLRRSPDPPRVPSPKNESLSYGEPASQIAPSPDPKKKAEETNNPAATASHGQDGQERGEAELFAYMKGKAAEISDPALARRPSRAGTVLLLAVLCVTCGVAFLKAPPAQWPRNLDLLDQYVARAGRNWLNPPPAASPQTTAQHESFAQAGDEYKLPAAGNIPDATTDQSQIKVLPVVDPTAKPANASPTAGVGQSPPPPTTNDKSPDQAATGASEAPQNPNQETAITAAPAADRSTAATTPEPGSSAATPPRQNPLVAPSDVPSQRPLASLAQNPPQPHTVAPPTSAGIPSSLKSQMASSTPDASGNKPAEAALPTIGPVDLTESAARSLLVQQVEPAYPDAAKSTAQHGSVVLQVIIGPDGTVQDAKFLQGSLAFARDAIDAVKQWRFKPYFMNGRPVAARTVLTLNFKPPA